MDEQDIKKYLEDLKMKQILEEIINSDNVMDDVLGFREVMENKILNDFVKKDEPVVKDIEGKCKLTLVPRRIIWDIAKIREYGNKKYPAGGPDNWKKTDKQNYRDAAMRHFLLYLDDPRSVDEESGYRHLWHLACNIAFLCEMDDDEFADDAE